VAFTGIRQRKVGKICDAARPARGGTGAAELTNDYSPPAATGTLTEPTPAPIEPAPPPYWLEFDLPPEAAARLTRLPAIARQRQGRARSLAEEVVWLDTAAGSLAAQGLVLERRRRETALRRTLPEAGAAWRPGDLAEPAAAPADPSALVMAMPLAAFTGRRTLLTLADGTEAELLQGRLRAVADELPVARLRLSGEAAAVLALARALAAELPLLPGPDLAELGRALARGEPPRPRRIGAAEVTPGATVEQALEQVIGHLLEVMLHHAPRCLPDAGPVGVHQARVALRRLRSALKHFRPAARCPELDGFDKELGALARRLGPARDWDVFLGGLGARLGAALPEDKRVAQLLKAAEARRLAAYAALREALDGPGFRLLVLDGLALLHSRPWRAVEQPSPLLDHPADEFAANLLEKRWAKLGEEGAEIAALDTEALHELRLGCKRLRYAAELFAPLWPGKNTRRFLRRLAAVQEALGLANDIAVARQLVATLLTGAPAATPWAVGLAEGFALAQLRNTRAEGEEAWEKLRDARHFWDAP
jgi:CHAD domain-containing protein